ncbi:Crp/Fnr family transcriptional regulator [Mammaliicoccus sciuri]|uniref:cAMP-binding domain of CRP or a regulatory subunit of cAMP-dependent protein kinases n=1 Tax=Sporosarcina newyorkensis TaxID=759851 RepID=A0A1T4XYT8_9BACL|nr:Crp/Fnr family transcriptional regulator [Sporosarcina newyorkensis]SKA94722.1 cAMP-binding domain of CRP or a regulatory subunit of cAMP-dependent protein kinases [Sporosarcina newyorkensis]
MKVKENKPAFLATLTNNELENDFRNIFIQHAMVHHYEKNEFVFLSGEKPNSVYFIEKGLLKVCQATAEGDDVTFFLRKRGEIFGYAEVILEENRSRLAQCLDQCTIRALSSDIFLKEVIANKRMNQEILKITNRRLLEQQQMVELLISQPVSIRLAWLLKEMSIAQTGGYLIETTLTHSELSNIIGCSRQTVSEILSKWREQGLISYDRKTIFIQDIYSIF